MTSAQFLIRHIPAFAALLIIGIIYAIIADHLFPHGLVLGLLVGLILLLLLAIRSGNRRMRRMLGMITLSVITLAEASSTSALVLNVINSSGQSDQVPHAIALALLRNSALIWLVNILTFSFWYWEIDDGGPSQRHYKGYQSRDLLFPQLAGDPKTDWLPHYTDYLFFAFNTSTAFSPTDTMALSVRIKFLMMAQSLISLTLLAIIAARAINTL
jgi:multisubunit Na+/H+ antiporter MnhE subunit